MHITFSQKFTKQRNKAPKAIQKAFDNRLRLFLVNRFDSLLNNHGLKGQYFGYRSINITGDWRAVYRDLNDDGIYFSAFGTHSQLYK
jgi:addiction module RelE/StbE family toxin